MPKGVREGRLIVLIYIILFIGVSLFTFVSSVYYGGIQNLFGQLAQVFISILLAWLLYKGFDWARKLLAVLTISASILSLLMLFNVRQFSWNVLLWCLYLLTTGTAGITLVVSDRVKRFVEYQNKISRQNK